jgi:manganese/zinc/iron transport system permease protein
VQANQKELELTAQGRQWAEGIVRSHRLWEAFLGQHFDLPLDHLHDPAERMEHFIGPDLQQTLAEELQKPEVDPHGRVIPPSGEGNS